MKIKRFQRHGNSRAIVVDKPILEMLGIDENTIVVLRTDGKSLIIEVAADQEAARRKFETGKNS